MTTFCGIFPYTQYTFLFFCSIQLLNVSKRKALLSVYPSNRIKFTSWCDKILLFIYLKNNSNLLFLYWINRARQWCEVCIGYRLCSCFIINYYWIRIISSILSPLDITFTLVEHCFMRKKFCLFLFFVHHFENSLI